MKNNIRDLNDLKVFITKKYVNKDYSHIDLNSKGKKQVKVEYNFIDSLSLYMVVKAYEIFQPLFIISNDERIHNYLKVWGHIVDKAKVYNLMDEQVSNFVNDCKIDKEEIYKIVVSLIYYGLELAREDSPVLHQKYKGVK